MSVKTINNQSLAPAVLAFLSTIILLSAMIAVIIFDNEYFTAVADITMLVFMPLSFISWDYCLEHIPPPDNYDEDVSN